MEKKWPGRWFMEWKTRAYILRITREKRKRKSEPPVSQISHITR
jgi:hypothetical protein